MRYFVILPLLLAWLPAIAWAQLPSVASVDAQIGMADSDLLQLADLKTKLAAMHHSTDDVDAMIRQITEAKVRLGDLRKRVVDAAQPK